MIRKTLAHWRYSEEKGSAGIDYPERLSRNRAQRPSRNQKPGTIFEVKK
jgi:hypothetical protein